MRLSSRKTACALINPPFLKKSKKTFSSQNRKVKAHEGTKAQNKMRSWSRKTHFFFLVPLFPCVPSLFGSGYTNKIFTLFA